MAADGRRSIPAEAHQRAGRTLAARKRARGEPVKPTPPEAAPEPHAATVTTYAPADEPGWVSEHHRASCTCGWVGTDWIGKEHAKGQGAWHVWREHTDTSRADHD